jgi:hypothetical protein
MGGWWWETFYSTQCGRFLQKHIKCRLAIEITFTQWNRTSFTFLGWGPWEGRSLHHQTSVFGRSGACFYQNKFQRERGSHRHTSFGLQQGMDAKTNHRKGKCNCPLLLVYDREVHTYCIVCTYCFVLGWWHLLGANMTLSFYTAILPIPPRSWVNSSMYAIPCLPILRHRYRWCLVHITSPRNKCLWQRWGIFLACTANSTYVPYDTFWRGELQVMNLIIILWYFGALSSPSLACSV